MPANDTTQVHEVTKLCLSCTKHTRRLTNVASSKSNLLSNALAFSNVQMATSTFLIVAPVYDCNSTPHSTRCQRACTSTTCVHVSPPPLPLVHRTPLWLASCHPRICHATGASSTLPLCATRPTVSTVQCKQNKNDLITFSRASTTSGSATIIF